MCQAIPRRVLAVEAEGLEVDYDGARLWVEARGLTSIAVGDYVIVYAGLALERIEPDHAEELLALYADIDTLTQGAFG